MLSRTLRAAERSALDGIDDRFGMSPWFLLGVYVAGLFVMLYAVIATDRRRRRERDPATHVTRQIRSRLSLDWTLLTGSSSRLIVARIRPWRDPIRYMLA